MVSRGVLLVAMVLAGSARADSTDAQFVTLDRIDGRTTARLDLWHLSGSESGDTSSHPFSATRLELHGQWVSKVGASNVGAGVFASAGVARLTYDDRSTSGVPAAELGALLVVPLRHGIDNVFRLGLAVRPRTSADDAEVSRFSEGARIGDLALDQENETSWLRLSTSPLIRAGHAQLRADLGLDVPLTGKQQDPGLRTFVEPLLRAGVGITAGARHNIGAELVGIVGRSSLGNGRAFADAAATIAFTYRFKVGQTELYAALVALINGGSVTSLVIGGSRSSCRAGSSR